ncbi:MAG: hypothetical protein WB762_30270 [Candidatus Sulfotelmatobacter sp.]
MCTTPISGERVFSLAFMASVTYVAATIPRLVCLEVVEALRPALRQRSNVTVMRIKAVVDMAEKVVRAVLLRRRFWLPGHIFHPVAEHAVDQSRQLIILS